MYRNIFIYIKSMLYLYQEYVVFISRVCCATKYINEMTGNYFNDDDIAPPSEKKNVIIS